MTEGRKANFRYPPNEISFPEYFFSRVRATTFAEAPMGVRFPPKHTPIESVHQTGERSAKTVGFRAGRCLITGIMVAVKGMLSTNPLKTKATKYMTGRKIINELPKLLSNECASVFNTPVSSKAPVSKNKPIKKNIVSHSTSFKCFSTLLGSRTKTDKNPIPSAIMELSTFKNS